MLISLAALGCGEYNKHIPEQLVYVKPCPASQEGESSPSGKACLCLEFMLADTYGSPTASDGKVIIKVLKGGGSIHNFKVRHHDFHRKEVSSIGVAYASQAPADKPLCCRVGPIPLSKYSSQTAIKVMFEFERPDGQLFRREVSFNL
jgi:hypothetical protein